MEALLETSTMVAYRPVFGPTGVTDRATDLADGEIVARVLSGDKCAFPILVERYSRRIFRICSAITRDHDEAEDCLQKTFLLAWERLAQFRAEAQFSTWLKRIAVNAALSNLRRRSPSRAVEVPIGTDGNSTIQLIDGRRDPEAACFQGELRKLLETQTKTLSPLLRLVLILRDVEELSTEETARILGISQAAVKTRLMRARLKMRDKLAPSSIGRRRKAGPVPAPVPRNGIYAFAPPILPTSSASL